MTDKRRLIGFFTSSTARLAGTYLLIIMAMSIGFSLVFYHASSQQLGRQLPSAAMISQSYGSETNTNPATDGGQMGQGGSGGGQAPPLDRFLQQRVDQGRSILRERLIVLNIGALIVGSVISYYLARRSLQPIEAAMEAQVQFVSDASHELRTPLTAIQASNEVFLRKPKPTLKAARELIEQNTEDIKRLKQLSDGLLKLSKQSRTLAPKLQPVHLQLVVGEALNSVTQQAMQKNISLDDELSDAVLLADQTTLVQVFVILLDNAIKYSRASGRIRLHDYKKGKYAFISVSDEGIGIRASDIPHLFRRFYRADNARTAQQHGGYGLGLAIAKQIIDTHQGDISVVSQPEKGTTFTLKLLLAES